jgi:Tetracyclin repressor-like, C-terminal domain
VVAGRAVLFATSRFHHPAHAAEWLHPAIDAAYNDVWQLLMDGLTARVPRVKKIENDGDDARGGKTEP